MVNGEPSVQYAIFGAIPIAFFTHSVWSLEKITQKRVLISGDFTLDINPVKLEDDASYQCQVGAAQGVAPIRSDVSFQSKDIPAKKFGQIYLTAFFRTPT